MDSLVLRSLKEANFHGNFHQIIELLDKHADADAHVQRLRAAVHYNKELAELSTFSVENSVTIRNGGGAWSFRQGANDTTGVVGFSYAAEPVLIFLDDILLKVVNPRPTNDGVYCFDFTIREPFESFLTKNNSFCVATHSAKLMHLSGLYEYRFPIKGDGKGWFRKATNLGYIMTKGGWMKLPLGRNEPLIETFLELYTEARAVFRKELGCDLFIIYGSLLGVMRNGQFIPHDDDVDVAYISKENSAEAAADEKKNLIKALIAAGLSVGVSGDRRYLIVKDRKGNAAFDIFTGWENAGTIYLLNTTILEDTDSSMFYPCQEVLMRGRSVALPAKPEEFLRRKYGANWLTPDVTYQTRADWKLVSAAFKMHGLSEETVQDLLGVES